MTNRPTSTGFTRWSRVLGVTLLAGVLFALTAQSASAVLPSIANQGFESWSAGAPDNWTIQSGGTVQASASPHSGSFALSFNDPNTSNLSARMLAPGGTLTSGQPVVQDRSYRFAAWAQSDRGASSPVLTVWFTNDLDTQIGSKYSVRGDLFGVTSSTWKQMEITRQAPSGATKIVVQLGMYGGTGGGIRFDDVTLDEINAAAGDTDVYSGWTVQRSADLGSGFTVNVPAPGSISFTAPGGDGYELNGSAWASQTFPRPIDSLSFRVTFSPLWDANRLQPIVWSNPSGNGVPVVLGIFTPADGLEQDVTLSSLGTRRIDVTCSAVRGPSDNLMDATFSRIRALSPVWRFLNKRNGFYLWTADPMEKISIEKNLATTWKSEGPAYAVNVASTQNQSPLWRFRNIKGGFYLYTADANEKNNIIKTLAKTWKFEGEAYRVSTNKLASPVWRFRNRHNGTYFYTADVNEKNNIYVFYPMDWQLEGPAYYLATY